MTETIQRLPVVKTRTGLSRSSIYRKIAEGDFPPAIKLGARAIGWPKSVIDKWIEEKIQAMQGKGVSK